LQASILADAGPHHKPAHTWRARVRAAANERAGGPAQSWRK